MTEIRIYEDHNKVVITRKKTDNYDKLHELIADALDWQDDSYEYYRLPLDEFMHSIVTLLSVTEPENK